MNQIERLARAYCEELGINPDARVRLSPFGGSIARWRLSADKAEAMLASTAWEAALARPLASEDAQ